MARETRLHLPYSLYYVGLQGNADQNLFLDKADGLYFYELLTQGQAKFGYSILGFCFIDNHVHLAVQITQQPLSKIIHNLTFRYTRYFNQRHQRQGYLFRGRYKATLVQHEKYLPDLIRYIHLTPVRLSIASKPEDYLWSSHRVYLGKEQLPWVNSQALIQRFDADNKIAIDKYQSYIVAGMEHGRPRDLVAEKFTGRVFGDDDFISQTLRQAEQEVKSSAITLDELIVIVCRHYALEESELVSLGKQRSTSTARGVLAYLVKQCAHISFTELAKRVKRDATTLSAHASRVEKLCKSDSELSEFINRIKNQVI